MEVGRESDLLVTMPHLHGLVWQDHRRTPPPRQFTELVGDGGHHFLRVDIARDDDEEIIRRVFFPVIIVEIVAPQLVENIEVPDDRVTAGMDGVGGLEKGLAEDLIGIVLPHRDLAPYHFALVLKFILGDRGETDHVTEDVETDFRPARGRVDPVNGAIKGGVGIDVAALRLHRLRDLVGTAPARAFEEHVLKVMRHARAEPGALVDAAGAAPGLQAHDGGGAVLLHDDLEPVRQGRDPRRGRGECERIDFPAQSSLDFAG